MPSVRNYPPRTIAPERTLGNRIPGPIPLADAGKISIICSWARDPARTRFRSMPSNALSVHNSLEDVEHASNGAIPGKLPSPPSTAVAERPRLGWI